MYFAFDLISDLHIDTWPKTDWNMMATSPFCVIAGDVGRDREEVLEFLQHISRYYTAVFYIDGNDEHRYFYSNTGESYRELAQRIGDIEDVVYLQDNVVVLEGVAILGTNGWWTYDFDPTIDDDQTVRWVAESYGITVDQAESIRLMAAQDTRYLINSVKRLQTHQDVKHIVIVTHTSPRVDFVNHDPMINSSYRINTTGNSLMPMVLAEDTMQKVRAWTFGHYHGEVDCVRDGIRYVSNPRGRAGDYWNKIVYYPKRIVIEL